MTYPRSTLGIGFWTSLDTKASHTPRTPETSRPVELTIESMSAECPRVPTKIGKEPFGTVEFIDIVRLARVGLIPVTLWMSATKSSAARCTPNQSSGETKTGAACWPLMTGKVSRLGWKVTQEGAPIDASTMSKLARSAERRDKARVPQSAILSSSQDSVWYNSSFLYLSGWSRKVLQGQLPSKKRINFGYGERLSFPWSFSSENKNPFSVVRVALSAVAYFYSWALVHLILTAGPSDVIRPTLSTVNRFKEARIQCKQASR